MFPTVLKPKLLIVELWGLGDLVIATPFIRAAAEKFEVTVLAKPYAQDLQRRFWPEVNVVPFSAPWTAFRFTDKYRFWKWPWRQMFRLRKQFRKQFDVGLSARWGDPRDHFLLAMFRARKRFGYPRLGSQRFLTHPLQRPAPIAHRYEYWRVLGTELGLQLPPLDKAFTPQSNLKPAVLVHSGAGQAVRVWPLPRYKALVNRLRKSDYTVQVACDADQHHWWLANDEAQVATPHNVSELLELIDRVGAFVGNDSGPGHLAALAGIPTFTLFGPQLPEWFSPMHPNAESVEGKPCPYKPCSDYCRFDVPLCLHGVMSEEIEPRVEAFLTRNLWSARAKTVTTLAGISSS
jgi:heptosyltransferase-2